MNQNIYDVKIRVDLQSLKKLIRQNTPTCIILNRNLQEL